MTKPPAPNHPKADDTSNRVVAVTLDEESIGRSGPDIEHERAIAIYDLIEQNLFAPDGAQAAGPFKLHIGITGNRLMFDIRREDDTPVPPHRQRLFHDLRQLLPGDPHRDTGQDRGHRYGPARHP
jgi:uncharacterized protein (UPF0262 family)